MAKKADEIKYYHENFLFDRRLIERNLRKGLTTPNQYAQFLSSLPDAALQVAESSEPFEPEPIAPATAKEPQKKTKERAKRKNTQQSYEIDTEAAEYD